MYDSISHFISACGWQEESCCHSTLQQSSGHRRIKVSVKHLS